MPVEFREFSELSLWAVLSFYLLPCIQHAMISLTKTSAAAYKHLIASDAGDGGVRDYYRKRKDGVDMRRSTLVR